MSNVHYTIPVTGLYQPQDLRNLLWHKCVRENRSLANVARLDYHNNLDRMIEEGLNANFMTRDRWFSPQTISNLLEDTCGLDFFARLGVGSDQFEQLRLTSLEYDLLSITYSDLVQHYGEVVARRELKRVGHTNDSYFLHDYKSTRGEVTATESEEDDWFL